MALAGNGVALARTSLVGQELASGLFVRPFGPVLDSVLGYHIIYRPQDAADPAIAAFRDWLLAAVAADPQLELRL